MVLTEDDLVRLPVVGHAGDGDLAQAAVDIGRGADVEPAVMGRLHISFDIVQHT